jgi:uncharacterized protein with PIN domain
MDEARWKEFKEGLEEEIEKARKGLLLAESFDEMEEIALEVGQVIHEQLLAAAAEEREQQRIGNCPECGGKLKKKGKKARQLKTSRGAVKIKRERYECENCGGSVFPPGQTVED